MAKKYMMAAALVMCLSIFTGCSLNNNSKTNDEVTQQVPPQKEPEDNACKNTDVNSGTKPVDSISEQIGKMSLDEKIGQMVISGIDGYSFDSNTKNLIDKYKVGGFIALGENVKDSQQLLDLLNSIRQENSKNKIPLFMSIDEEGGRITRMPDEFNKFPTNKVIGQINNKTFSYKIGSTIAREVKSFGFNMDFAPVLDVNSNPKNPVIGDRAFSSNAAVVGSLGTQTMKGIQSQNVIAVVKHFPGHGDTSVDSHKGLPSVDNDLKRLQSLELVPFAEAIKNNVDVVMIAHILLPKIDTENPSSMSKTVITDMLRTGLKFNGVVITDDMTMGAIMKNYNIGEAAVKSVNAGADIVLVCHEYNNEVAVIDSLKNAVLQGQISEKRIDESVYRILKLKQKYNLKDERIKTVDVAHINKEIDTLLSSYIKQ